MIDINYTKAAENIAGGPVSIEPDGTVWTGTYDNSTAIDPKAVMAEAARLSAEQEAQVAARRSGLAKLAKASGLTADELIALMGDNFIQPAAPETP